MGMMITVTFTIIVLSTILQRSSTFFTALPHLQIHLRQRLNPRMSNKLINSPESCVEDVVQGALLSDSRLSRIGNLNILVRSDIEAVKKDKVTLISG